MLKYILIALIFCQSAFAQTLVKPKVLLEEKNVKNAYPRLSKDGAEILYQTNRSGKWQLRILNIATLQSKPVLEDSFNDNFPDWSYDNQWIAFVSDRDGNEEIYVMKTDGTQLRRMTNNPARDIHPYFSPDGKFLLFNSDRGKSAFDVYRIRLPDGEPERLTDTPQDETCARYSPDMKRLVLLQNDPTADAVCYFDPTAKTFTNITDTPHVVHGWPMFSFDGKWVYYSSRESGLYCIYRVSVDGKIKQQLSRPAGKEDDARTNVSRDGKHMVYNKELGETISICYADLP